MNAPFRHGCDGKTRYETWRDANRAMVAMVKRAGSDEFGKPKTYHCRHCNGFHYGRERNLRLLNGNEKRAKLRWETVGV